MQIWAATPSYSMWEEGGQNSVIGKLLRPDVFCEDSE